MKKMMLLASVVALAAMMLAAAPAFADDNNNGRDFCDHHDCFDNNDNNDRDIFRNIGNVDVSPNIDISQDIDQDADSGDISQPVSVTGGGDNSIQTVGVQPTANTGNAQNATGVLQAAPIVAGLGGDTVINNDDNNGFGRDFCDHHDCFDNNDREVFRNIGNDQLNINGPDFGDVGVDSNSSIDLSPTQTVNGGGEINQAAAASSQ